MSHFRESRCPFGTNIMAAKWLKGKMVILQEILWVCGTEGDFKPGKDPSLRPTGICVLGSTDAQRFVTAVNC